MATRKVVVVLALFLAAIVGLASANETAPSTADLPVPAEAPISDDLIGTSDGAVAGAPSGGDGEVVPGPMGSGAGATGGPSESPNGDAAALKFSAITGVAAVAGYVFF